MQSLFSKEQFHQKFHTLRGWMPVFSDRTVLMMIVLFCAGIGVMVWHVHHLQSRLVETMAIAHGDLYTQALSEFRTLYTKDVVERIRTQGIEVTHDYEVKPNAIPLPATLSMKLGARIGTHQAGAKTHLYSPFPFPWRTREGGLKDDFARRAWDYFTQHPGQPFYQFVTVDGRPSLRYATADLMRESCVNCHNTHPDSPKTDWKVNDVRGILEIIHPMNTIVAETRTGIGETFGLMSVLALLWLGGVGLVIAKVGRTSQLLEQQVHQRTAELRKAINESQKRILERGQAEAALARLNRRTNLILNSAYEGIYGLDLEGNTTFVNSAAANMLGFEPEDLFGMPMHATVHHTKPDGSHYPRKDCPMYLAFKDGTVHQVEDEVLWRKDGSNFPVEYTSTPIRDEKDQLIGAVVTFRDITERKRAAEDLQRSEKQLRQAQKMEAIGTLAGGIAHDFNNILWVILGNTERTLRKLQEDSPVRSLLENVLIAAKRAKSLIEQILAFSRHTEPQVQPVRLDLVVQEGLQLLRATVPASIEFRVNIPPNCGTVMGDPTHLHQVFMNLCTNAYQAMGETGILGTSLDAIDIDQRSELYIPDMKPGPYLLLTVSDTGSGMDKQKVERIFDPFFTTKEVGKGTGLGLAMVHGIVTSMGGFIKVYSEPGEGSTFRIYLPRSESSILSETTPRDHLAQGSSGAEVLLIDDEEQVLSLVQGMLEDMGHVVTPCRESGKALDLFRTDPGRYDLVITDQTMPKMTGVELVRDFHQLRPELPVILATGFSNIISEKNYEEFGIFAYVRKPVEFGDLERTVQNALIEGRKKYHVADSHH